MGIIETQWELLLVTEGDVRRHCYRVGVRGLVGFKVAEGMEGLQLSKSRLT